MSREFGPFRICPERPLALAVGASLSFGSGLGALCPQGLAFRGLHAAVLWSVLWPWHGCPQPLPWVQGIPFLARLPGSPRFHRCLLAATSSGSLPCSRRLQLQLWDTGTASHRFSSSHVGGLWQNSVVLSGEGHSIPAARVPSRIFPLGVLLLPPGVVGTVVGSVPSCVLLLSVRGWHWLLPVALLGKRGSQFPQ